MTKFMGTNGYFEEIWRGNLAKANLTEFVVGIWFSWNLGAIFDIKILKRVGWGSRVEMNQRGSSDKISKGEACFHLILGKKVGGAEVGRSFFDKAFYKSDRFYIILGGFSDQNRLKNLSLWFSWKIDKKQCFG